MQQQAFLPTGAMKESEKKKLNVNLCLAPFTYKFVLLFNLIPDKSNSIQPFVKLLIYENLFIDLLVENPIKVPI